MYEYVVVKAKSEEEAEKAMNEMAKKGWRVTSTTYIPLTIYLEITFSREKKD